MKKELLLKPLALGIVALFICVSYQPIIAEKTISVEKTSDYNNVDFEQAKEYLFQTIIDISNNPEVKAFLNQHKRDLIINNNNNYDCRNAIQIIHKQNPRLLKSIIFTKPKMTYEYLEKNFNKGLEIVDILGEEESLKIAESVKIANPELLNELNNIIKNDKELSNRILTLEIMNNDLKLEPPFMTHPIICAFMILMCIPIFILLLFFSIPMKIIMDNIDFIKKHPVLAILCSFIAEGFFITLLFMAVFYSTAMAICLY
jgi:hypothetical protein